jgi:hypothetical protein
MLVFKQGFCYKPTCPEAIFGLRLSGCALIGSVYRGEAKPEWRI